MALYEDGAFGSSIAFSRGVERIFERRSLLGSISILLVELGNSFLLGCSGVNTANETVDFQGWMEISPVAVDGQSCIKKWLVSDSEGSRS